MNEPMRFALTVIAGCVAASPHAMAQDVYPVTQCNQPSFNSDQTGCGDWQMYWNRVASAHQSGNWANCPWNSAAYACWPTAREYWACPATAKGIPITIGDLLRLHDWAVKVFRDAYGDGKWAGHPRASAVWEYFDGATLDIDLGASKQAEIENAVSSLNTDDIVFLATILLQYSSLHDTEAWFKYVLDRVPGCSGQPTTLLRVQSLYKEWKSRSATAHQVTD